jgi:hypothetical protein
VRSTGDFVTTRRIRCSASTRLATCPTTPNADLLFQVVSRRYGDQLAEAVTLEAGLSRSRFEATANTLEHDRVEDRALLLAFEDADVCHQSPHAAWI